MCEVSVYCIIGSFWIKKHFPKITNQTQKNNGNSKKNCWKIVFLLLKTSPIIPYISMADSSWNTLYVLTRKAPLTHHWFSHFPGTPMTIFLTRKIKLNHILHIHTVNSIHSCVSVSKCLASRRSKRRRGRGDSITECMAKSLLLSNGAKWQVTHCHPRERAKRPLDSHYTQDLSYHSLH